MQPGPEFVPRGERSLRGGLRVLISAREGVREDTFPFHEGCITVANAKECFLSPVASVCQIARRPPNLLLLCGGFPLTPLLEFRSATRRLSRSPGLATLAIATLALGLAINATMFALLDALLFRPPFHVGNAADVVRLQFRANPPEAGLIARTHYPGFSDLAASGALSASAAYTNRSTSVRIAGELRVAEALIVSESFFGLLRPLPQVGALSVSDDTVVVSHDFWKRHLARSVVEGTPIEVDGRMYSIAGVAPVHFNVASTQRVDLWLPLSHAASSGLVPENWRHDRGPFWLGVIGRLAPDVERGVAHQRLTGALRAGDPNPDGTAALLEVVSMPLVPGRGPDKTMESTVSLWLAALSTLVLLIACANLAALALARVFTSRKDYVLRIALGASRRHLLQPVLFDTLLLVAPAFSLALTLSFLFRMGLSKSVAPSTPLSTSFLDGRATAIAGAAACLVFVVLAVAFVLQTRLALRLSRLPGEAIRGPLSFARWRYVLTGLQTGLVFVLLFIAGLFSRSVARLEALDLGASLDRTIQVTVGFGPHQKTKDQIGAFFERAQNVLSEDPGVERVALAAGSPYRSGQAVAPWTAERGPMELWSEREAAYRSAVGTGFFSAVGAESLRGRDFNRGDQAGTERVVIVNEPLASYLWPSKEPIGECLWMDEQPACFRVVGVIGGAWKFSALERDKMAVYVPIGQAVAAIPSVLFVRPRTGNQEFIERVRSVVQSLEPGLPAAKVSLLSDIVAPEFAPWRLGAKVFGVYASVGLAIAAAGLYAVVAVGVGSRRREIGIRMAMGARRRDIVRAVAGESLISVATGLVVGSALALIATSRIGDVLFQTSPQDPLTLALSAMILLVVTCGAAIVPSLRAARTDAAAAIRMD